MGRSMPRRILFVCLGNICRSPAAEAIGRARAAEAGLSVEFDSCGLGSWNLGAAPYGPMRKAAERRGYDLSALRARMLTPEDYTRFDLLLALDRDILAVVEDSAPPAATARVALFLPPGLGRDVPDPYYTRDFDGALDLIERGTEHLLARLSAETR